MQLVVADTGPINYLALIDHIDLLPALFAKVILPATVYAELTHLKTPPAVRELISSLPAWLDVRNDQPLAIDPLLEGLDDGERAAITLAVEIHADLVLMDDRDGFSVARGKGLRVTGTPGILDLAAERGLINFSAAIKKLEATRFRRPVALLAALLEKHR